MFFSPFLSLPQKGVVMLMMKKAGDNCCCCNAFFNFAKIQISVVRAEFHFISCFLNNISYYFI